MKIKNIIFTLYFLFVGILSFAQPNQQNKKLEASVFCDNDYLVPNLKSDRNYTYGLFAQINYLPKNPTLFIFSKNAETYLHTYGVGLMGYTPNYEAENFDPLSTKDRPFAGWLYIEYKQQYLFERSFFNIGLKVGTMGENAHAGEVQNNYHNLVGFDYVEGWETQVPNFIGVNLEGNYQNKLFDNALGFLYFKTNASLGTVKTNFDNRLGLAFGKNPTLFGFTRLHNEENKNAFFAQIDGGFNYTFHDATLEGNPFSNKAFLNDKEFNNSTFIASLSVRWLTNNWAVVYSGTYETETVENADSHRFGRLSILRTF